ncbi:MAG: Ca2+-binding RTX toxin-like protein [Sneathiella sp.]|jgi:Ca2+-binding RTX toxin-like protein
MLGGDDNDVMRGDAGDDSMSGDAGDDWMHGGSGNDDMSGGAGVDTMFGGAGSADVMDGGAGNDLMYGDNGDGAEVGDDDTMLGGDGDDVMFGEGGADLMSGGAGNDNMSGGAGNDLIFGDAGDDNISAGTGDDTVWGGSNNNYNDGVGSSGNDYVDLGDGNDRFDDNFINSGQDTVRGGDGNDIMWTGDGDDVLYGDAGNDSLFGENGNDHMEGGSGQDAMRGGSGDDTMLGGDDNDVMRGDAGDDSMSGDAGDDWMHGGSGNDDMSGGDGVDTMFGGAGSADVMDGGAGSDLMYGDNGDNAEVGDNDTMHGGDGDDVMFGEGGADVMYGDDGSDTMSGGAGNDVISGGRNNDVLRGEDGDDILDGGRGRDDLEGGSGDDHLIGGRGHDTLTGGSGDDTVEGGRGNDTLRWTMSDQENVSTDTYNGGNNGDTLELFFTQAEFDANEEAIAEFANRVENGEVDATLTIGGRTLVANNIENVAVMVDNVEIPVLIDDLIETDENVDSLGNIITATLATPTQDFIPNDGDVSFNAPGAVSVTMPGAAFPQTFGEGDWNQVGQVWTIDLVDGSDNYGTLIFDASNPENVQVSLDVPAGQDTIYDPMDDGDQAQIVFDYSATVDGVEDATVTININGVNDAPIAGDDIVITNTLDGIYVPQYAMLANDTDIEGDPLNVASVTPDASLAGDDVYVPGSNRIINGSFEDHGTDVNIGHGSWATYNSVPGWFVDLDGADAPIELQFGGTGGIGAQDGNTKMELDSHNEGGYTQSNSHVYQDVSTTPGEELTVSFWYSPRSSGSTNDVEVYWDGELLTTLSGTTKGWTEFSFEVDAGSGSETRLEFHGLPTEDTQGGYIDNVYVGDRDYDYQVSDGDLEDTGHVDVQYQTGNYLAGGDANEIIIGGDEADTISGGDGDDTLIGGEGNDVLDAGDGDDTFHYSDADTDGDDIILNFEEGDDTINLDAVFDELGIAPDARADMVNLTLDSGNTVITVDGQSDFSITVHGSDLTGDGSLTQEQLLAQNGIVVSDES